MIVSLTYLAIGFLHYVRVWIWLQSHRSLIFDIASASRLRFASISSFVIFNGNGPQSGTCSSLSVAECRVSVADCGIGSILSGPASRLRSISASCAFALALQSGSCVIIPPLPSSYQADAVPSHARAVLFHAPHSLKLPLLVECIPLRLSAFVR